MFGPRKNLATLINSNEKSIRNPLFYEKDLLDFGKDFPANIRLRKAVLPTYLDYLGQEEMGS
jgi:hypothetical protein